MIMFKLWSQAKQANSVAQLSLAISVNDKPPRTAVKKFGIGNNMRQVTVPRILKQ